MKLGKLPSKLVIKENNSVFKKVDKYLFAKHNEEPTYEQRASNSPSLYGSSCYRKIYYAYWRVPKDQKINARAAKIFELGHYIEEMVMEWFKAVGVYIPYRELSGEIPADRRTGKPNPQFPISHPDFRVRRGYVDNVGFVDDNLWLFEIKSTKAEKFAELDGPMPEHRVQASIYFDSFVLAQERGDYAHIPELVGAPRPKGIKYIYVNKDTSEVSEIDYLEPAIQETLVQVRQKAADLLPYFESKELPSKTPDKCFFCSFKAKCDKDWNDPTTFAKE